MIHDFSLYVIIYITVVLILYTIFFIIGLIRTHMLDNIYKRSRDTIMEILNDIKNSLGEDNNGKK